ncbi:hypothetical protein SpCBS45565_g07368 [Spizellomyces sp. 'palustris']|nr:hypothetical protein SpCBS45565_g07368 [Spizellomyces sp. 'palustris']
MMQSSEVNLARMKVASEARLAEEARVQQRQKNAMVLILSHLESHGLAESNVSLRKIRAADNMDLMTILQEFESYYSIKFGKAPKLTRKAYTGDDNTSSTPSNRRSRGNVPSEPPSVKQADGRIDTHANPATLKMAGIPRPPRRSITKSVDPDPQNPGKKPTGRPASSSGKESGTGLGEEGIVGVNMCLKQNSAPNLGPSSSLERDSAETLYDTRLLKPLPDYGNIEFRELAAIISRDIFVTNPNVRWSDIAGLARSKRLVKEAVVYPLKFPDFFKGILMPWKGLLLYGPPGTGKTMIAKAVATECNTTFFNISASSIAQIGAGDSEKLVRVLFELARYHAPSTIFLDELESIMSHRTSDGAEHEASRRMKTELLIQMDGLSKTSDHVFLLAASNLPWDLDMAMLRRLEKRILIDLPDTPARKAIFEAHLPQNSDIDNLPVGELDYEKLALMTEGYSGSDIKLVCKEAAMRPIRKFFDIFDAHTESLDSFTLNASVQREPVRQADVEAAVTSTRPSANQALGERYRQWGDEFGSS